MAVCCSLLLAIIFPSLSITSSTFLAISSSTFLSFPITFAIAANNLDRPDLESTKRPWNHQFNGRVGEWTWNGSAGKFRKRAWNSQFSGGMGKRAWNSQFNGGMGKRAWNSQFSGGMGKRAWVRSFSGGLGK